MADWADAEKPSTQHHGCPMPPVNPLERSRVNPLVAAVVPPPIGQAQAWVAGRTYPPDRPLIDLSQALPADPPPVALTQHLVERLADPAVHRYTDILGLPALRAALAADIAAVYETRAVDGAQVAITAGANQAFCLAMMALAGPGDDVLLPLPCYFNHKMWLEMLGLRGVPLAFRPDAGGLPDPEEAAAGIGPRTRAIVLVSPNNPAGAVYPPDLLATFYALAKRHRLALLVDETYRDFRLDDAPPHRLFDDSDWPETLVHLYSFSKVYSLSGYRVGALAAGLPLLAEIAKLLDCVTISAPHIGQEAALYGLLHLGAWRRARAAAMRRRLTALESAFAADHDYRLVTAGPYFAYVKHPFANRDAAETARLLAADHGLLTLPGSAFGPGQERYLRLAFANVSEDMLPTVAQRLATSRKD